MQFKVPQFLDIEDKIFGPFTFSEFSYLVGGAGLSFIIYKLFGFFLGFIPIILVVGFSLALVFYKPNNKPFINMLENGFKYLIQDKLFIWKRKTQKKDNKNGKQKKSIETQESAIEGPKLTGSKLNDLAWSLDVLDLKKENNNQN